MKKRYLGYISCPLTTFTRYYFGMKRQRCDKDPLLYFYLLFKIWFLKRIQIEDKSSHNVCVIIKKNLIKRQQEKQNQYITVR